LTAPIEAGLLPGITREIIQTLAASEKVPIKEGHSLRKISTVPTRRSSAAR